MPLVRMRPLKYYKEHNGGSVFNADVPIAKSLVENEQADYVEEQVPPVAIVEAPPEPEPEPEATEETDEEPAEDEVDEGDDEFPSTEEELQAMGKKALRELAKKAGIDTEGMKKKTIVAAILA